MSARAFQRGRKQSRIAADATAMGAAHACIATPCLRRQVRMQFAQSLMAAVLPLQAAGARCEHVSVQSSHLAHARNQLCAAALREDFTHLLFVDDDVSFDPEGPARLLAHGLDVVSGVYVDRSPERRPCAAPLQDAVTATGLVEVAWAGTGFLMIGRHALRRMQEAHPEGPFAWDTLAADAAEGSNPPGEDVVWCQHWRALGGCIFVDPGIELIHWCEIGLTQPWVAASPLQGAWR